MSNLDPFTQKLIKRTKARKEARLKRQLTGLPEQYDSSSPTSTTVSPAKKFDSTQPPRIPLKSSSVTITVASVKKFDLTASPRIPLAEKNNDLEKTLCEPSPGRSEGSKKRQSSEDLSSILEKRAKTDDNESNVPAQFTPIAVNDILNKSPVCKVTVKASLQDSPTESPLRNYNIPIGLQGNPKEKVKCSLQSRLGRLNRQYTEQFEVDSAEEKRLKETEDIWEVRKKEHLKQQEEERTRILQEKIFGKDYLKQKEEKTKQLKEKYLAGIKNNSLQNIIKKTEGPKQGCPKLETTAKTPSKNQKGEAVAGEVKDSKVKSGNNGNKNMVIGIKGRNDGKAGEEQNIKKAEGPVVNPKPLRRIKKSETVAADTDEVVFRNCPANDRNEENDGNEDNDGNEEEINRSKRWTVSDLDEKLERSHSGSVRDKKSIFEDKMKKEWDAGNKEKETDAWLQRRSSRQSAFLNHVEIPSTSTANKELTDNNTDSLKKELSIFKPVTDLCEHQPNMATAQSVPVNVNENMASAENDKELPKTPYTSKSKITHRKAGENVTKRKIQSTESPNTNQKPIISVVSMENDLTENKIDTVENGITENKVDTVDNGLTENKVDTPTKAYNIDDMNSPQPNDCTEDTTFFPDSQAFDASSILRHAYYEELHRKPERGHANRCSTMKVEPFDIAMVQPPPDLNVTPIQNESEDDEALSEFAKAIKRKVTSIKSSSQRQKLEAIDVKTRPLVDDKMTVAGANNDEIAAVANNDEIAAVTNDDKTVAVTNDDKTVAVTNGKKKKTRSTEKRPAKPPRININKNVHKSDDIPPKNVPQNIIDHLKLEKSNAAKEDSGVKERKQKHRSSGCDEVENIISKPSEKYSRMKMRRSSSFSEGLVITPIKSGYHREVSAKYNAYACFDKPDIVDSKKEQIQNLLEEAACQQNIVLQASQALNVADCSNEDKSNSPEVIEGERLLLLATERRTVCLEEVKALKESDFDPCDTKDEAIPPCKATLAVTDIKLPLHRDFVSSLKNRKHEVGLFHFIIIFSAGNKNVYSTKVVSCYDEMEDYALLMKSSIMMKNIPHDFTLTMKVFGMHSGRHNDQITKFKRSASNNQSSPGNLKNLFSKRSSKDEEYTYYASPQTVFRTSNLKLVGECKVNFNLLGNGVSKYVLMKVPNNCPIEGCIQLRANCKPEFSTTVSGFLTILEDVGGYTAWNRRWCKMVDSRILYWRYPDEEKDKEAIGSIDLRYSTDKIVSLLSRDICARPHTFELTLKRASLPTDKVNLITTIEGKITRIKYWFCTDNKDDRITWMDTVNKQLSDSRAWRLKKISVKSITTEHQV